MDDPIEKLTYSDNQAKGRHSEAFFDILICLKIILLLILDGIIVATCLSVIYVLNWYTKMLNLGNDHFVEYLLGLSGSFYIILYAILAGITIINMLRWYFGGKNDKE